MPPWRPVPDHYPAKLRTPREHGDPVVHGGGGPCQASRCRVSRCQVSRCGPRGWWAGPPRPPRSAACSTAPGWEPLRVPGEAVLAVRPLRLADAMELFFLRAAQAGVEIPAQSRATVASVCVQLDKLPLAIELAAAELGVRSSGRPPGAAIARQLAELLAGLEAGHDLPARAGEPGRHQTMRAAIGWSHELCTPSERLLWARLSVFAGPFGPRDAQDVCASGQLPDEAVAAGLTLLTERSVLLADRTDGDGGPRYLLPATLRGYGRRMLRRLGQDEGFTARHRVWQDRPPPHHQTPRGRWRPPRSDP